LKGALWKVKVSGAPADIWAEMTNIRTNCPRCGEVEMEASVVLLSVDEASGEGTYSFVCPDCLEVVEKPADQKIVTLLLSAGVEVHQTTATVEADTRRVPGGPPLTTDDLIDFHFLLSQEDWFSQLVAAAE
jgi:predicted RNA-binding Zn-ribbon protein involved in translation (DUF1610 family)